MYDNDLRINEETASFSRLMSTKNLIGPITISYDISENAKSIQSRMGGEILDFTLNFDGADCRGEERNRSIITGASPTTEQSIICTFDQVKVYKPTGTYTFRNLTNEIKQLDIALENIEIRGLLNITEQENKNGDTILTINAGNNRRLGVPRWKEYAYNNLDTKNPWTAGKEVQENIISLPIEKQPKLLGLTIFANSTEHDRVFLVKEQEYKNSEGIIEVTQNAANTQEYIFTLTGATQDANTILNVEWFMNNNLRMCAEYRRETCVQTFTSPGEWRITAKVNLVGGRTLTFNKNFKIDNPISLERHARILNRSGKMLNEEEIFDVKTKTYVIKDIYPPETLIFDARDVISSNPGYILTEVNWMINDGSNTETRAGKRIEYKLTRTARYNIRAEYTFQNTTAGKSDDIKKAYDDIRFDLDRRNITPVLKISKNSDYVPARITVDASESRSEHSELIKFIFNFGEGRPDAVGDASEISYTYTTSGEKTITLTVVDENNERATIKETIVLKDAPKTLGFTPSLSPAEAGKPVDFKATNTTGQIEEYIWNFGDNTPVQYGYEASHIFRNAGNYTVTMTVKYLDGTERSTSQVFKVVESLE